MKQYSLLQEMNWAKVAHNAIGSVGQSAATKGALIGSVAGGIKGARDADAQGRSSFGGAVKGALLGAGAGAAVGTGAKMLARTDAAKELQADLFNKAKEIKKNEVMKNALRDTQRAGVNIIGKDGKYTKEAQRAMRDALAKDRGFGTSTTWLGNTKMFDKGATAASEEAALKKARRWGARGSLMQPAFAAYDFATGAGDAIKGAALGGKVSGF